MKISKILSTIQISLSILCLLFFGAITLLPYGISATNWVSHMSMGTFIMMMFAFPFATLVIGTVQAIFASSKHDNHKRSWIAGITGAVLSVPMSMSLNGWFTITAISAIIIISINISAILDNEYEPVLAENKTVNTNNEGGAWNAYSAIIAQLFLMVAQVGAYLVLCIGHYVEGVNSLHFWDQIAITLSTISLFILPFFITLIGGYQVMQSNSVEHHQKLYWWIGISALVSFVPFAFLIPLVLNIVYLSKLDKNNNHL